MEEGTQYLAFSGNTNRTDAMCQALIDDAVTRIPLNKAGAVIASQDDDECVPKLVTDYSSDEGEANKSDYENNIGQGARVEGAGTKRKAHR